MNDLTPELRDEIAQHLRASSGIRLGMILRDVEEGLDAEQIAVPPTHPARSRKRLRESSSRRCLAESCRRPRRRR